MIYMINNSGDGFVHLVDELMVAISKLFAASTLTAKDHHVESYDLFFKFQERVKKEELENLLSNEVLPNMPEYTWDVEDVANLIMPLAIFLKKKGFFEIVSDKILEVSQNDNKEAEKFFKEFLRVAFSEMQKTASEQIALMRTERISDNNLINLKVSREFIETMSFINKNLNVVISDMNTSKKLNEDMNRYVQVILLFLRIYSISFKVKKNQLDSALKEIRLLGLERTNYSLRG